MNVITRIFKPGTPLSRIRQLLEYDQIIKPEFVSFTSIIMLFLFLNPLSLISDQHQFSPNNINALSREKGVRINKMITKGKMI